MEFVDEGDEEEPIDAEELRELDDKIIGEMFMRVKGAKEQVDNYKNAGVFLLFAILYFTVLYLQAHSEIGYRVTSAHQDLIPPSFQPGQANRFSGPSEFYSWLNDSIIQELWKDPYCGDGVCNRPLEFPAFGSFGCAPDCGYFLNVTPIVLQMDANFQSESDRLASSWNICLINPVNLCWFPSPQVFPKMKGTFTHKLEVVDGEWQVVITAPKGGVSGVILGPVDTSLEGSEKLDGIQAWKQLASWGDCLPDGESRLTLCRETCATMSHCIADMCERQNSPLAQRRLSGFIVSCMQECDSDTPAVLAYQGQRCSNWTSAVPGFFNFPGCANASEADGVTSPDTPQPTIPPGDKGLQPLNITIADLPSDTLWTALGSSDTQRLFNIRVAANRLLYTAAKDYCLVDLFPMPSTRERDNLTAFLCSLVGGPLTLPGCAPDALAAGPTDPVSVIQKLWLYVRSLFQGYGATLQHQHRFVDLLVASVESVVPLTDEHSTELYRLMGLFDSAAVNTSLSGCTLDGAVLMWANKEFYNTTLHLHSKVTWVWDNDEPHSIQGVTPTPESEFRGFGSNHMIVSRGSICRPEAVDWNDAEDDPTPCVIRSRWDSANSFSFTQIFREAGTYFYKEGRSGANHLGQINVRLKPQAGARDGRSLDTSCSPGCTYMQLSDGRCDTGCNNPNCAFDGGDCACSQPGVDFPLCTCPFGQSRSHEGRCCDSSCTGENLNFSFRLTTFGDDFMASTSVLDRSSAPLARDVSGRNRLIIGMFLVQRRFAGVPCNTQLLKDFSSCTSSELDTASFGINPFFLEGSPLFSSTSQAQTERFNASQFAFPLEYNREKIPLGFIRTQIHDAAGLGGYPLIFDLNLDNQGATNRLQYLVDGSYLDNSTEGIDISIITFNGNSASFALTSLTVNADSGGSYSASVSVETIPVENYTWSAENVARFVMEIIYLCALFWNIMEEILEMVNCKMETGKFRSYFRNSWNFLDLISIALQLAGVGLWIYLMSYSTALFNVQPRYNVYFTLVEFPRYWSMPNPPTGFYAAADALKSLQYAIHIRYIYFAIQGISVFLITVRVLKLLHFQPYLGIITRSILVAAPALVHFFVVWLIVFTSFALFAFLVFGSYMEEFSTLWRSFLTCFLVMMNDNSVQYNFLYMSGWGYAAAILWWFSFTCIVVFVLLNFLIAIVVDAFMSSKDMEIHPTTILQDLRTMLHRARGRGFGTYWRYEKLIKHLYALGADDFRKAAATSMRRNSLARALRGFNFGAFCGTSPVWAPVEPTKKVLRVGSGGKGDGTAGHCLDYPTLNNALLRAYRRNLSQPSVRHSSRWMEKLHTHTIPQHRDPPDEDKLDRLAQALMSMFGEEVETQKLIRTARPRPAASGRHNEMMELRGRMEMLQEDTMLAMAELREMVRELREPLQQPEHEQGSESPREQQENDVIDERLVQMQERTTISSPNGAPASKQTEQSQQHNEQHMHGDGT